MRWHGQLGHLGQEPVRPNSSALYAGSLMVWTTHRCSWPRPRPRPGRRRVFDRGNCGLKLPVVSTITTITTITLRLPPLPKRVGSNRIHRFRYGPGRLVQIIGLMAPLGGLQSMLRPGAALPSAGPLKRTHFPLKTPLTIQHLGHAQPDATRRGLVRA